MRFTKLSLFIARTIGILMLGVPRAAHAVIAALVQVWSNVESTMVELNFLFPLSILTGVVNDSLCRSVRTTLSTCTTRI
jgi:hypothetical protein